jgi:hypothetical protein
MSELCMSKYLWSDTGVAPLDVLSSTAEDVSSQSSSVSSAITWWLVGRGLYEGRSSMLMSGIELIDERLGPGVMPLRFTTGALAVLEPVTDGLFLCVGASTGELGGSVSGVVGLEDS